MGLKYCKDIIKNCHKSHPGMLDVNCQSKMASRNNPRNPSINGSIPREPVQQKRPHNSSKNRLKCQIGVGKTLGWLRGKTPP